MIVITYKTRDKYLALLFNKVTQLRGPVYLLLHSNDERRKTVKMLETTLRATLSVERHNSWDVLLHYKLALLLALRLGLVVFIKGLIRFGFVSR